MKASHSEDQPGLEILPDSVHNLCEVADQGQHRQHGCDVRTAIPLARPTRCQVGGVTVRHMESGITQDATDNGGMTECAY